MTDDTQAPLSCASVGKRIGDTIHGYHGKVAGNAMTFSIWSSSARHQNGPVKAVGNYMAETKITLGLRWW